MNSHCKGLDTGWDGKVGPFVQGVGGWASAFHFLSNAVLMMYCVVYSKGRTAPGGGRWRPGHQEGGPLFPIIPRDARL